MTGYAIQHFLCDFSHFETVCLNPQVPPRQNPGESHEATRPVPSPSEPRTVVTARGWRDRAKMAAESQASQTRRNTKVWYTLHIIFYILFLLLVTNYITCEGGERKPARVFSVKPARKMISNIDYPIISHLSNMPTFFWAKTRQIRGADTPRGRNVPGKEAGQRQTKWHTVWCAISICHTWPRR